MVLGLIRRLKGRKISDLRYDLSIIKKVDSIGNKDHLARFVILLVLGVTIGLTHALWVPLGLFAVYLAALALHAFTVSKMPRVVGSAGMAVVVASNALVQVMTFAPALYLWGQADFELKCVGLFMVAGKMVNSMSERSEDRVLVVTDVLAMALGVVAFYVSFADETHMVSDKNLLGIGFVLILAYFLNGVVSVRRARQRLRRAQAKVTEAQKMEAVGRLTGAMAHDFNNLLTSVLGNLELAHEVETLEEKLVLCGNAHASAERAARLTAQLLAFARRAPLDPQDVDLAVFLASTRALLQGVLAGAATLEIGSLSGQGMVRVDPALLETALVNLVLNAREAMQTPGRVTLSLRQVQVTARTAGLDLAPGSYVGLEVSDTGAGIPKRLQARVLEPFFSTKPVGGGSGLGLSMAKGFAEQSGGGLMLRSEEGHGTEVTLLFPPLAPGRSSVRSEGQAASSR